MRRIPGLLIPAVLLLLASEAPAQGVLQPGPYGFGWSRGGALLRSRKQLRLGIGLLGAYGLGPTRPLRCLPYGGEVRIYAFYSPPPVVLFAGPGPLTPRRSPLDDPDIPPVPGADDLPPPRPEPPRPPERPRVVPPPLPPPPPPKEERPMPPAPAPPPKEAPKKEAPRPAAKEDRPRELPRPPAPADDPGEEHARLTARGEEAFKDLEYGRAAQRFRQAVRLRPAAPRPYFLLAQALLAQGKYHEAQDAVLAGLRRQPDWPAHHFRPLELYGEAVAEYPEQLAVLQATLDRHPGDPVLLFLWAYELWFDGRKEEARPVLRRALLRGADRDAVDLFLRALPAEEL